MFRQSFLLIAFCGHVIGQTKDDAIPEGPAEDYVDRGQDGSYRFGYKNFDIGNHYHAAVASRDNTVSGRYGHRDPASRRIIQTTYTAGKRGFRARGPHIARQMDLSQSKISYQPPIPPNSPAYQPTYDGYHDPNEDPSYKFNLKTPTYSRGEAADSKGTVIGAYSFIDDIGKRHDIQYEAGTDTGFVVKTAFPDSDTFGGVFYRGPNKPGTPPRGHSSIVQNNDGSYQFTAAGPDQKRIEISDSAGRVRGSYTYIDDKGVQRTVQYVAGPNIGYKVIRKGTGPIYSAVYPHAGPEFLSPPFPDNIIPDILPPTSSALPPSTLVNDVFEPTLNPAKSADEDNNNHDFVVSKKPYSTSTFLPEYSTTEKPIYYTSPKPYSTLKPFKQDTNNYFGNGGSGKGDSNYGITLNTELKPPYDDIYDEKIEYENTASNDYGKPVSNGGRKYETANRRPSNGYLYPKPTKSFKEESRDYLNPIEDNGYSGTSKNFLGLPPGVSVRAHVQSLDILPYGSKIPPPDETLQRHLFEELNSKDRYEYFTKDLCIYIRKL